MISGLPKDEKYKNECKLDHVLCEDQDTYFLPRSREFRRDHTFDRFSTKLLETDQNRQSDQDITSEKIMSTIDLIVITLCTQTSKAGQNSLDAHCYNKMFT